MIFQSTLSVRRATNSVSIAMAGTQFQSTLSVRRATRSRCASLLDAGFQSTLSVRRATPTTEIRPKAKIFQSTLSVRRATVDAFLLLLGQVQFQSTLSVRRATRQHLTRHDFTAISIHALRKESDLKHKERYKETIKFQSTLSVRRATRAAGHFCPLSETQASCLALSISNNTTGTTNNMPKTSSCLSVSF